MISMKSLAGFVTVASIAGAALIGSASADQQGAKADKPAAAKAQAKVGEKAPNFTLTDTDGTQHSLSDFAGKVVVLEWFNPGCPFVVKHHEKNKTMADLAAEFGAKDVVWVAINSGAPGKQGHGLELNKKFKKDWGINYPILLDEPGEVGKMYGARTTPQMYIIDKDGVLRYNGAIDNDPSAGTLGTVNYVRQALNEVLAGETVTTPETRPYGCSVKYN
ncbi:MAG: thioredoxin family protein [Phycisphaeraceae bacterium]|nr:thioredoxin family protein [Phycisphaeraceae bacterium]